MTEAEPPTIPVTNGTKEYTTKDIEELRSRLQTSIKKTDSSSPNILPNTNFISNAMLEEEPTKKLDVLDDDQPLMPANTTVDYNENDKTKAAIEGDSEEC